MQFSNPRGTGKAAEASVALTPTVAILVLNSDLNVSTVCSLKAYLLKGSLSKSGNGASCV